MRAPAAYLPYIDDATSLVNVTTLSELHHGTSISKFHKCWRTCPVQISFPQVGRGINSQTEEEHNNIKCTQESSRKQCWNVEILHRGFSRNQSWPSTRSGYESALHCLCIHAPHLGKIHPRVIEPITSHLI